MEFILLPQRRAQDQIKESHGIAANWKKELQLLGGLFTTFMRSSSANSTLIDLLVAKTSGPTSFATLMLSTIVCGSI